MIFRLEYKNRNGLQARLDITTPGSSVVKEIEGTENPFILSYKGDKSDKSSHFLTSSAEINIYETPEFNIDRLKTSSETQIKVDYYIDDDKHWEGFVIPDFFSREIGGAGVVSMTASDRISTLKGVTLSDLPAMVQIRDLAVRCLERTGLDLPLKTMADFRATELGFNQYFRSEIASQRLYDSKGRSISCYDILKSILVASGSTLRQIGGEWHIINKLQHEAGAGRVYSTENTSVDYVESVHYFDEIVKGARRTIIPVAGSVGIYHEYGGGKLHPDNYDFSQGLTGWTPVGGFVAGIGNHSVNGYKIESGVYVPDYGEVGLNHLKNANPYQRNVNPIYLESAPISVPYSGSGAVNIEFDINGIGPMLTTQAVMRIAIVAQKGEELLTLHHGGAFNPMPSSNPPVFEKRFKKGFTSPDFTAGADTQSMRVSGTLESSELEGWELKVRIYGGGSSNTILINAASIHMKSSQETPRGAIYKRDQGADFTKTHDIETAIFGDYLTTGKDGYFYDYPIDDTSSIHNPYSGISSLWTTPYFPTETDALPILQHVVRQQARMFSVAHDLISGEIEIERFDPLSIFVDCNGKRYVIVSASFDFLRSSVKIELEEIAYANLTVRDFIYSYFGEGESGISSVGGISTGTGGGGVDLGIIGGINDRIDEVGQRMDDIKVGVSNLLRNTGFLGDFTSLEVDAITAVLENTPVNTNPLVHWVHVDAEVIDAPSRSGKGARIGSLQQNVDLRAGESYVLSFMAKGTSLTVNLVDDIEVELTNEFKRYSFDIVSPNTGSFIFWITDPSLSAEVYEIMLSEGNTDVDYAYAAEDDLKAIAQLQAINSITSVIKDMDSDILGGLILTSMIQLGKYKDGKMEKVNAGINGIYNNDDDPAVWAGGSFEDAIRTVQRIKENPYSISEDEWSDLANIVMTHGGDGIFRGIIYALGGLFRGKVESNSSGNRIIIDPDDRSIKALGANGKVRFSLSFTEEAEEWGVETLLRMYTYNAEGERLMRVLLNPTQITFQSFTNPAVQASFGLSGVSVLMYEEVESVLDVKMDFDVSWNSIAGAMDVKMEGLRTSASGLPPGHLYKDGGFLKIT